MSKEMTAVSNKEPLMHISKRDEIDMWKAWAIRLGAVLLSLVVCAGVIYALTGLNPLEVYKGIFDGAVGTKRRTWMTIRDTLVLLCIAMTCVYNKEQLCSKGDIDVTGENATSANETSCGSFRERTGSSMKDSYTDDCGCDKIQIDCKAHNCTYNDNCKCTASSIQVDGSNAHASSDTRCDTFQCHCGA